MNEANFLTCKKREATCKTGRSETGRERVPTQKQFGDLNVDIHLKTVQILVDCLVFSVTSLFHASCFGRVVFPLMPNFVHESRVMGSRIPNNISQAAAD